MNNTLSQEEKEQQNLYLFKEISKQTEERLDEKEENLGNCTTKKLVSQHELEHLGKYMQHRLHLITVND